MDNEIAEYVNGSIAVSTYASTNCTGDVTKKVDHPLLECYADASGTYSSVMVPGPTLVLMNLYPHTGCSGTPMVRPLAVPLTCIPTCDANLGLHVDVALMWL